jgi:hypothetical protein
MDDVEWSPIPFFIRDREDGDKIEEGLYSFPGKFGV